MLLEKGSQKTLAAFLKHDIRNIEKKPFTELYPRLLEGDQVWIYRDADANAIARLMPYAHVVVYLGQNEKGQGEVVHVTNNERCRTPCRTALWRKPLRNLELRIFYLCSHFLGYELFQIENI